MDTFSKLQPPNAVHIKVKIVSQLNENSEEVEEEREELEKNISRPRPRSAHINDFNSFFQTSPSSLSSNNNNEPSQINGPKNKYKLLAAKKLFVDPTMTSYDVLYKLIVQAFDLKK